MSAAQLLAQRVAAEHLRAAAGRHDSSATNNRSTTETMQPLVRNSENAQITEKCDNYAPQAQAETAQSTSGSAAATADSTNVYSLAMMAAQNAMEAASSSSSPASSAPLQVAETHVTGSAHAAPDKPSGRGESLDAHSLAMMAAQSALEDSSTPTAAHAEAVTAQDVEEMTHEAQLKQFLIGGGLQSTEVALNDCPDSKRRQNGTTKHMRRRPRRGSDYITDHPTSHGKPVTISTTTSSKYNDCRRFSQNDALDMASDDEENSVSNSVSDISTASRTSRSNSQSMSRTSSLSGNLSGSKRPSTDSLSVTGHLQRVLVSTTDGSSSSGLGGRRTLSRTMSSKRSRGSLSKSFRSNLGMVGENSTLMTSNDTSGETKSNADWNLASQPATHHLSSSHLLHPRAGSSAGLHRPPNMLLHQNQHISSSHRNMSGLGVGGAPSHASLSNAPNQFLSNNALTSMDSRMSMTSNASGPISAPKPKNPFLGGGSTSAAANFLSLMGPDPTTTTTTSHPPKSSTRQVSASGPSGPSPQLAKMHGLSGATRDFLSLLQQPAGIGSVQALIQSQNGRTQPVAHDQLQTKGGNEATATAATPVQPESIKIPSIFGTCRGSTPRKVDGGIKVKDDGTVVNGQTASDAHQAQTVSNDPSNMSPQELLVATIEARGGEATIRPVLSVDDKFHTHTDEEIAAYPPTAMLVRNNDLAGLKMAHQSGGKLQTSNKFGESLLHIACRRGYDHIASYLIEEADVTVWVRDDFGRTPCHDACWTAKPNLELMDLLVRKCPEMLLMSDKRGSTPLDYVRRDNWDVWRKFLEERWDTIIPKKA